MVLDPKGKLKSDSQVRRQRGCPLLARPGDKHTSKALLDALLSSRPKKSSINTVLSLLKRLHLCHAESQFTGPTHDNAPP